MMKEEKESIKAQSKILQEQLKTLNKGKNLVGTYHINYGKNNGKHHKILRTQKNFVLKHSKVKTGTVN